MEQQPIVVLGAGFGGLRAALRIERGLRRANLAGRYRVVLVDQHSYHTYTPLLTETAATLEESFRERKEAAVLPVADSLRGTNIVFIQDRVTDIDAGKRMVAFLHQQPLQYSMLLVALGSVTNYFDIPGLREHALPLKTLADAQQLAMRLHEYASGNAQVRVLIGGGGATGIGLAGGLATLGSTLRRQLGRFGLDITVIEGQPSILPGFLPSVIARVAEKLTRRGVRFVTGKHIVRAEADTISLDDGTTLPYDIFVWTGGIKASPLVEQLSAQLDHGRAAVDGTMACIPASQDLSLEATIYAIGDIVCYHDPRTGAAVPWVAQAAIRQADVAAHNILERLKAQQIHGYIPRPCNYMPATYPYIIPLGTDAVAHIGTTTFSGFPARFLRWLVELHYLISLLSLPKALRMWWRSRKVTV